jgi:hypothetical protein
MTSAGGIGVVYLLTTTFLAEVVNPPGILPAVPSTSPSPPEA